jgi:hypothetical protein
MLPRASDVEVMEGEMGGALSTHWSDEKCVQNYGRRT